MAQLRSFLNNPKRLCQFLAAFQLYDVLSAPLFSAFPSMHCMVTSHHVTLSQHKSHLTVSMVCLGPGSWTGERALLWATTSMDKLQATSQLEHPWSFETSLCGSTLCDYTHNQLVWQTLDNVQFPKSHNFQVTHPHKLKYISPTNPMMHWSNPMVHWLCCFLLTYDAVNGTLGYQIEIHHFV